MNKKQFKQQSHDLVVNIASTIGTFAADLELTDDDLAKTQKLVKKFDETLTEFIDSRKPKFKVGDYVCEVDPGYFFEISDVADGFAYGDFSYYLTKNKIRNFYFETNVKNLRHATPEEIAEYKAALNFHEHGRKPFEVKKGDLVGKNCGKRLVVDNPGTYIKELFYKSGYKLLKTAEELEEWLGADDE